MQSSPKSRKSMAIIKFGFSSNNNGFLSIQYRIPSNQTRMLFSIPKLQNSGEPLFSKEKFGTAIEAVDSEFKMLQRVDLWYDFLLFIILIIFLFNEKTTDLIMVRIPDLLHNWK